jgi:hypothetical protein
MWNEMQTTKNLHCEDGPAQGNLNAFIKVGQATEFSHPNTLDAVVWFVVCSDQVTDSMFEMCQYLQITSLWLLQTPQPFEIAWSL